MSEKQKTISLSILLCVVIWFNWMFWIPIIEAPSEVKRLEQRIEELEHENHNTSQKGQ
jgi:hypothetical protein